MLKRPAVICLTPVLNEAWILDRFLKAASLWADHIIIADQQSTDGSREIARKYEKVILIDNPSGEYNESERQKLLIGEARKIKGPRLLIALDADEFLTPDVLSSTDWGQLLNSSPGTIIRFPWANLYPGFEKMWMGPNLACGYMDDDYQHEGIVIHSDRIPTPPDHQVLITEEIKVMHLQYTDWERMLSKHRWYQCFEVVNSGHQSAVRIFRQYHHMYAVEDTQILRVPDEWKLGYDRLGIEIAKVSIKTTCWWDDLVMGLIEEYGAKFFRKIYIWDYDWVEQARLSGKTDLSLFVDPRSRLDKWVHRWLIHTQKKHQKTPYRQVDKMIIRIFHY